MTLVYINALILLIGFELNVSIDKIKKDKDFNTYQELCEFKDFDFFIKVIFIHFYF